MIDELPPGRHADHDAASRRGTQPEVCEAVETSCEQGRQAYVVYPLVEESEKIDLADATRGADELQAALAATAAWSCCTGG